MVYRLKLSRLPVALWHSCVQLRIRPARLDSLTPKLLASSSTKCDIPRAIGPFLNWETLWRLETPKRGFSGDMRDLVDLKQRHCECPFDDGVDDLAKSLRSAYSMGVSRVRYAGSSHSQALVSTNGKTDCAELPHSSPSAWYTMSVTNCCAARL